MVNLLMIEYVKTDIKSDYFGHDKKPKKSLCVCLSITLSFHLNNSSQSVSSHSVAIILLEHKIPRLVITIRKIEMQSFWLQYLFVIPECQHFPRSSPRPRACRPVYRQPYWPASQPAWWTASGSRTGRQRPGFLENNCFCLMFTYRDYHFLLHT